KLLHCTLQCVYLFFLGGKLCIYVAINLRDTGHQHFAKGSVVTNNSFHLCGSHDFFSSRISTRRCKSSTNSTRRAIVSGTLLRCRLTAKRVAAAICSGVGSLMED